MYNLLAAVLILLSLLSNVTGGPLQIRDANLDAINTDAKIICNQNKPPAHNCLYIYYLQLQANQYNANVDHFLFNDDCYMVGYSPNIPYYKALDPKNSSTISKGKTQNGQGPFAFKTGLYSMVTVTLAEDAKHKAPGGDAWLDYFEQVGVKGKSPVRISQGKGVRGQIPFECFA